MATKEKVTKKAKKEPNVLTQKLELLPLPQKLKNDEQLKLAIHAFKINKETVIRVKKELGFEAFENAVSTQSKILAEYFRKKKLTEYLIDGKVIRCVKRTKSFWVLNDADIPPGVEATPLMEIIKKKYKRDKEKRQEIIKLVTTRVIDPLGVNEAVKAGYFTAEEIKDAFITVVDTQYMQIYNEVEADDGD